MGILHNAIRRWRRCILIALVFMGYSVCASAYSAANDSCSQSASYGDRCTVALKNNILFDLFLVPTIGIEIPVGNRWSVSADWVYGWIDTDRTHDYWRLYGGDVEARYWFGRGAGSKARRALTGHHLGVYAQVLTYDFEFGGRGYMGGKPHGTLWDKANFGGGVSYGYAKRVTRRLNIDFTIGLGYLGGQYQQYHPDHGCYVYERTRHLCYFGPTRAEVQVVWLLGHGGKRKGGAR